MTQIQPGLQSLGSDAGLDLEAGFTEARGVGAILGQTGFFDRHRIVFERQMAASRSSPWRSRRGSCGTGRRSDPWRCPIDGLPPGACKCQKLGAPWQASDRNVKGVR